MSGKNVPFAPDRYFQDFKKSLDTFTGYIKNSNNLLLGLRFL